MVTWIGYWMFIGLLTVFLLFLQLLSPVLGSNVFPLAVYWKKFYDSTGGYLFDQLLDKFELFVWRQAFPGC
jgi:hypothetical protein